MGESRRFPAPKAMLRNVLFAAFVLSTCSFVVLAYLLGGGPGGAAASPAAFLKLTPTFLDDPLGILLFVFACANFAFAFLGGPPLARGLLRRSVGQQRPDMVIMQFFVLSLALYESCAVFGLVYALAAPPAQPARHSLLLIAVLLALGGFVKARFVDLPDLEDTKAGQANPDGKED